MGPWLWASLPYVVKIDEILLHHSEFLTMKEEELGEQTPLDFLRKQLSHRELTQAFEDIARRSDMNPSTSDQRTTPGSEQTRSNKERLTDFWDALQWLVAIDEVLYDGVDYQVHAIGPNGVTLLRYLCHRLYSPELIGALSIYALPKLSKQGNTTFGPTTLRSPGSVGVMTCPLRQLRR
jgi:hypothetical protein